MADWMECNIPKGINRLLFSYCSPNFDSHHEWSGAPHLRNQAYRTRVVTSFPNEAACRSLISAILMEMSDEWEGGRVYLNPEG